MSSPFTTRLNCESLETRENPSGNVAVFVSGGAVILLGDAANNRINLSQDGFGNMVVVGLDNTTVNGQSSLFLGRGIPTTVYIDMGTGNDRAEVQNLVVTGNLFVNGSAGDDQIIVEGITAGSIMEVGGEGNDNIFTSRLITNYLILDGGSDSDIGHADTVNSAGVWVFNFESVY